MTAHVIEHPAAVKAEITSLVKLAHGQSRRAVSYRQWALEAAQHGQEHAANRWMAESIRSRENAKWHLQKAMERKDRYVHP